MTMGDETLFAEMAMPVVLGPILQKMEQKDAAAASQLRTVMYKVESQHPGFAYDFIKSILKKAEVLHRLDMTESFLRLEGLNPSTEFLVSRREAEFEKLNKNAVGLKKILSRIPDEIYERKKFLETIKDIASAIKHLLDAVNNIFQYVDPPHRQEVESKKKGFVKGSRNFSKSLKDYFKAAQKHDVFHSANHLINQTNQMMKTVRDVCQ
jgi:programmed cell death protein 10